MTQANGKSLVDQILDAWFAELESAEEFDGSAIAQLRELASSGAIKKPAQVTEAVKVIPEVQDETT
jgi:hypothetical protein